MVGTRFDLVTLDGDTTVLATFWSAALDLVELEQEDHGRWIVLGTRDGLRRIGLQTGPTRPGSMHLDLSVSPAEFTSEIDRLTGLGATVVRPTRDEPYGSIANLADPAGNPFDLCAYRGNVQE